MLTVDKKIKALKKFGMLLAEMENDSLTELDELRKISDRASQLNPWFTPASVKQALLAIGQSMAGDKIDQWIEPYLSGLTLGGKTSTVAVVNAGNIPAVGFHDLLCVLISGHQYLGKLSSDDQLLLPALVQLLTGIEPGFRDQAQFTSEKLTGFDAVIATGSNNTSRYFDYYFRSYPHIIRKNRNGVGVLTGNETREELSLLGKDIFSYYGLGCRNVSKLLVPEGYSFTTFFEAIEHYQPVIDLYKFKNNYDYYKSIYLVDQVSHFDNGFLIVVMDEGISSPPAVLYYEEYNDRKACQEWLNQHADEIQCIVGNKEFKNSIPFGKAQSPELWDYADGADTLQFLLSL